MKSKWTRLAALTLIAAFSFGGSFTCNGSTHDDDKPVQVVGN